MKKIIYCDMDGVLADFNNEPNAIERFKTEKGFFATLKPIKANLNALKHLAENNTIYILSASPNKQADKDKKTWLKQYAPFIKSRNVIIIRNGEKKVDFMKTKKGHLFDDYGKNISEWLENEKNTAFKINEHNNIWDWVNRA